MTYQVLARKWRPKSFAEIIGQEHVLQTLTNALNQNRLHHAYLFTGKQGVGKTTFGRILAKCFNCEQGVSATPCGQCGACLGIDSGRFVDLIEIDAASRTKVEDIRDILSNVQYAPNIGRYKIYLIDEVHMLSLHSFNALLKTLEEPPAHVKFLLATTDKQRLPITILSRCLQFNLKNIPSEKIAAHLKHILETEGIKHDESALRQLAKAAQGSARDALSLLDQAIAYGGGEVKKTDVESLLGMVAGDKLFQLCTALIQGDIKTVFATIAKLADLATDFAFVLEELLTLFHRIALLQAEPALAEGGWENLELLQSYAREISPEDLQLYYQIGLIGKRDLFLAPSLQSGFEMLMLRILAFRPESSIRTADTEKQIQVAGTDKDSANKITEAMPAKLAPNVAQQSISPEEWLQILMTFKLSGTTQGLIKHCSVDAFTNDVVELFLEPTQAALLNGKHEERLAQAFSDFFHRPIRVQIKLGNSNMTTLASISRQKHSEEQAKAKQVLGADPNVKILISAFDAKIVSDSKERWE